MYRVMRKHSGTGTPWHVVYGTYMLVLPAGRRWRTEKLIAQYREKRDALAHLVELQRPLAHLVDLQPHD